MSKGTAPFLPTVFVWIRRKGANQDKGLKRQTEFKLILQSFQEEPEYEEPPALPPRSDDFLEPDAPPLPHRSADVDEEENDGEYEELEPPPPVPPGLSLPSF